MLMMTILKTCFCFNVCLYSCCTCSADCFIFDNLATISNHLEVFFLHTGCRSLSVCKVFYLQVFVYLLEPLLPLKWPRYFHSRWCPGGGGGPWNSQENQFRTRILHLKKFWCETGFLGGSMELPRNQFRTRILHFKTIQNFNLKNLKNHFCKFFFLIMYRLKLVRIISILAKIWKTTFPKEFFNEIGLKVGEDEQIYITEITFWQKSILFQNGGQNNIFGIAQWC